MNEYKVIFSYSKEGKRVEEFDVCYASTTQDAVDKVRRWYNDLGLKGLKIERVYIDTGKSWDIREYWD
jgi:predicted TIM-barrel fold metal-dependent hydrolase